MIGDMKPDLGEQRQMGHPIDTGLIFEMPMNEGSGNIIRDSVGSNNGTLVNGVLWTPSTRRGRALYFDGSNDYVAAANNAINIFGGDFTFSIWHMPLDLASSARVMTYYFNATNFCQINNISVFATTATYRIGGKLNSSTETGKLSSTLLYKNEWHHIVGGVKNGEYFLYYNTIPQSLSNSTGYGVGTNIGLTLGARNNYTQNYLNGMLGLPRIWNRALSANEIMQMYIDSYYNYGEEM